MAALLESLRVWLEQIILAFGYIGIAVAMFVENLFPPIPSEAIMLFAGFLIRQGQLSFLGVLLAGTLGSVLGTGLIYFVGVWGDEPLLRRFLRRYGRSLLLTEAHLDHSLHVFQRHGRKMVFFGRMMPLVRTLISLPAGLNRMPLGRFWLLTALGSALWNGTMAGAGVLLGQNWVHMLAFTERYEKAVVVGLALLLLFWITRGIAGRYTRGRHLAGLTPHGWRKARPFRLGGRRLARKGYAEE